MFAGKGKGRIISLFLVFLCFIIFTPNIAVAATATATGPYSWRDPGGYVQRTAFITIDGQVVYCIDPSKTAPYGGHSYSDGQRYNDSMKAILYYGYGGDGNEIGNTMEDYVKTHVALSNWEHGKRTQSTYSNKDPEVWSLIQHAMRQDAPNYDVSFNKSYVSSWISGSVQVSDTITLTGNGEATLNIPWEVTIHVNGVGSQQGGSITIYSGQSFYFSAPLSYGTDFNTGNVNAKYTQLASILYLPSNTNYQRLARSSFVTDPVVKAGFTVDFEVRQKNITVQHIDRYTNALLASESYTRDIGSYYSFSPNSSILNGGNTYLPVDNNSQSGTLGTNDITLNFYYNLERTITVNHIDARDNRLITTESYKGLRGNTYSYGPITDLKKGTYNYRPLSTDQKSGTVGADNITLDFYYDVPLIKAGVKKVQIYTAPAADGLPVKVELEKTNIYQNDTPGMTTAKIDVNLYHGNKLVLSKPYTAQSLPTSIDMKIPSGNLAVNTNKPYTVKLEGYSTNEIDMVNSNLTTDGYTSSEQTLTVNPGSTSQLSYSGVIMTEREVGKEMKIYKEFLDLPLKKVPKKKTGYGFELPVDVTYKNELGSSMDTGFQMKLPSTLLDSSYISYPEKDGMVVVPLDKTKSDTTTTNGTTTLTNLFELPHVNIERVTGYLFSDQQVKDKDTRIKYDFKDGKRKFYTPIWGDLGNYPVSVNSTKPIGVNLVNVNIEDTLEIFASMFAHMDSPTTSQDEILLTPMNADDPTFPDNWTEEDKKVYFEWNEESKKEQEKGTTLKSKINSAFEFVFH